MLKAITFQPGIRKDITEYLAEGGWVDCDKIRFKNGNVSKMGGWVSETVSQYYKKGAFSSAFSSEFSTNIANYLFTGVARAVISWGALDGGKYLARASHTLVELLFNGQIFDITPKRATVNLTDALSTSGRSFSTAFSSAFSTTLSTLVQVTHNAHGASVGDYINVVSQATPVGGITLSGLYRVHTVVDSNNYLVDSLIGATNTVTHAGGALTIDYLLASGFENNEGITGWGGGGWNTPGAGGGGWNTPRAGVGASNMRQWSLDTWGEDLLACVRGGKIYHWDKTNGITTRLQAVANAPNTNSFILVSQPSRHLIAFGSEVYATGEFDPLIIRWADIETLTGWAITSANTAGEFRLPKGNTIIGAVQTRSEIVIFTETEVYSMRYVGGNDVFSISPLGTNISVASSHSFIDINGVIIWMGVDGFYMYDGVVKTLPSTIGKYLFTQDSAGRINFAQKEKIYCGINKEFHEIIWFYPKHDSLENSNYAKYNYLENVFDYGTITRTAWIDKGIFERPYGFGSNGKLYTHEQGYDDDASPMTAFVTSGYFDLDDGDDMMFVDKIVPDVDLDTGKSISITVLTKKYPHPEATVIEKGPYDFSDVNSKISTRARGRQMALKFESQTTDGDFELGKVRINVKPDGKR